MPPDVDWVALARESKPLLAAAAVFFFVVTPINHLMARRATEDPETKECPECTSAIPFAARRCPECTAQIGLVG